MPLADPFPSPTAESPVPEVEILTHHEDRSPWSTFHRIGYRVRRADGRWLPQEREFLDRGDAIALLPYCQAPRRIDAAGGVRRHSGPR